MRRKTREDGCQTTRRREAHEVSHGEAIFQLGFLFQTDCVDVEWTWAKGHSPRRGRVPESGQVVLRSSLPMESVVELQELSTLISENSEGVAGEGNRGIAP